MNALRRWMTAATAEEKSKLAKLAGLSRAALAWAAGGYRSGGRADVAPEAARKIELAAGKIARDGLPTIRREDLSPACGRCELAKRARK